MVSNPVLNGIKKWAEVSPDKIALCDHGQTCTYAQLQDRIAEVKDVITGVAGHQNGIAACDQQLSVDSVIRVLAIMVSRNSYLDVRNPGNMVEDEYVKFFDPLLKINNTSIALNENAARDNENNRKVYQHYPLVIAGKDSEGRINGFGITGTDLAFHLQSIQSFYNIRQNDTILLDAFNNGLNF